MAMGSIGRAMSFEEKDIILRRDNVVSNFFLRKSVLLKEHALIEEISEDVEEQLYILLCWYRDLLIAKFIMVDKEGSMKDECERKYSILLNIDRVREISSYADRSSKEKLENDILTIIKTIGYVRSNINPKIALFNMAVELKENKK